MKKRLLLLVSCLNFIVIFSSRAQITGCTDPQSTNYNPAATINDGSCAYNATTLTLTTKTSLSAPLLNETSGLTFINGKLWTFNDSGNANDIYRVDSATSTVYQTVDISNATNVDWEDMTTSNDYLYIGDFGNNNGDRQNLKIYRITKADLTASATAVTASVINFSYSDQTSFQSLPTNHNFDCEAMIFLNDSIHLFSKNWVDFQTKHYVLPATPGTHVAQYRETYNTGFLVTSAAVQSYGVIALIGYLKTGTKPVSMAMIYDYKNNLLFNGNKRKFDLSTQLTYGQVEGVEFFNTSRAFVTNELFTSGTTTVTAKLRTFDISSYLPASFLYPKPTANFTANNVTVCTNASITFTNQTTNAPVSYQWLFPGATPATSTSQNPQVQYSAAGAYSVTLIATNAAGSDTIVKTNYITVNAAPVSAITAAGSTTICQGNSVTLNATAGAGISFQWKNNGVNISGATASSYQATAAGTYTCYITGACGSVTSNAIDVVVNPAPVSTITAAGPTAFCPGGSVTLNATPGAGLSFQWLNNNATISGATNSSYAANAAGNYSCSITGTCGSVLSNVIGVSINPGPSAPATPSGLIYVCKSTTNNLYSVATVSGATSYTWSVPAGATVASGQGSNAISVDYSSVAVSGNICVYASSGCGNSTTTCYAVTVMSAVPAKPASISGNTIQCPGTTGIVFSCPLVANASSYNWSVPSTATLVSGQGTNSITVNFLSAFTSGSVKVAAVNCKGSSAFRTITVYGKPATPGTISGQTVGICAGSNNVVYSIAAVTAATGYNWTAPPNATIISGQGTTNVTLNFNSSFTTGSLTVSANNACGSSSARTTTIRSTPNTPGTISGSTSVCANQTGVSYSIAAVSGATIYNWVVPAGAIITSGQNTTSITVSFGSAGGTVKVRSGNACGNSTYRTLSVGVTCREAIAVADTKIQISIAPNPASSHFTLQGPSELNSIPVLIIRDLSGKELQRYENIGSENFDFGESLPPGVYLAEIYGTDQRTIFRLVKL